MSEEIAILEKNIMLMKEEKSLTSLNEIIIKLHDIAREGNIPELRKVADDICQIQKRYMGSN